MGISEEKQQSDGYSRFFAAGSVIFFVALGQVVNIIQEMLIAAYFGTTWITDAYKMSMAVPTLFSTESIGIINAVVIPILYTGKTFEEQRRIFSALLVFFIVVSITLWLVILLCASPLIALIAHGFSSEGQLLAVSLLTVTSSLVVLTILSTFAGNILNSRNEFGLPALQKVFMFAMIIPALYFGVSRFGIAAAAWGAVIGMIVFTMIVFWRLSRHHFTLVKGNFWKDPAIVQCIVLATPLIIYSLFNQVNVLFEKKIAADFPAGTLSALDYALKSSVFFINFLGVGITTVIFPTLSEKNVEGDTQSLRNYAERLLSFIILLVTPFILFLLIFRTEFIQVLFERGAFTPDATAATSTMLGYYALGLLGHAVVMTFPRFFQATRNNTIIMRVGIAMVGVNIVGLIVFPYLFGPVGIPISFIVTYMLHACILLFRLHGIIKLRWNAVGLQALRIVFPCILFAVFLLGVHSIAPFCSITLWGARFGILAGTCLLSGILYLVLAAMMKVIVAEEIIRRGIAAIRRLI
ncbi:MAG: lipid II flippase MurJ [Bacteroidota bacterium]